MPTNNKRSWAEIEELNVARYAGGRIDQEQIDKLVKEDGQVYPMFCTATGCDEGFARTPVITLRDDEKHDGKWSGEALCTSHLYLLHYAADQDEE